MAANKETFLKNYVDFTRKSLKWCCDESEKEATSIFSSLSTIMEDIKRRSAMTENTLAAVEKVKATIQARKLSPAANVSISELIVGLKNLSGDNSEIQNLTNPIVEALQFQDRLRQNLENIGKAMDYWIKNRTAEMSEVEFGEGLMKCMTSPEERTLIRDKIGGLAPEQTVTEDALFF
jgi:hypothetical protein